MNQTVTSIVSVYKSDGILEGCLLDLTRQSLFKRGELEIIIIDAASPQDETQWVKAFQAEFPNAIRYHRTRNRIGLYKAWNIGAKMAKGSFLTNANVDDRHESSCLERLRDALIENERLELVYGQQKTSRIVIDSFEDADYCCCNIPPVGFTPLLLLLHPGGCHPMWRKETHDRLGGFDEQFRIIGDYDFSIRLGSTGQISRVDEAWSVFTISDHALSARDKSQEFDLLQTKHFNFETLLKLYGSEGWKFDTDEERIRIIKDFIWRSLAYFHFWAGRLVYRNNFGWLDRLTSPLVEWGDLEWVNNMSRALSNLHKGYPEDILILWNADSSKILSLNDNIGLLSPLPIPIEKGEPISLSRNPIPKNHNSLSLWMHLRSSIVTQIENKMMESAEGTKFVVYGCGELGTQIVNDLDDRSSSIVGFTDRLSEKWGGQFMGKPVQSFEYWLNKSMQLIIIPGTWDFDGIAHHLKSERCDLNVQFFSPETIPAYENL